MNIIVYRKNWQYDLFKKNKPLIRRKPWQVLRQLIKLAKSKDIKVKFTKSRSLYASCARKDDREIIIGRYIENKKNNSVRTDIKALVTVLGHEIGHFINYEAGIAGGWYISKAILKSELKASSHALRLLHGFRSYHYCKKLLRVCYKTYRRDYIKAYGRGALPCTKN